MTLILAVADTHLRAGQATRLIDRIPQALARADIIVHAGDIVDGSVLDELARFAPLHAVLGNNDHGMVLPERLVVDIDGCEIAVVHDSGASAGRGARLGRWFPTADVVVFGHSHAPWNQTVDVQVDGRTHRQHHLNPGSAMQRRQQPRCTIGWIEITNGTVVHVAHEAVPVG
jgi:putative phosphoesterase